ncbi:MAG TPA: hypothetical protein VFQ77_00800 [Pseudonocardiaceae bacterium]|nr:hypothetical protein [Pseudonocardiaceae bacterium]
MDEERARPQRVVRLQVARGPHRGTEHRRRGRSEQDQHRERERRAGEGQ